jgi:hypothetical protein
MVDFGKLVDGKLMFLIQFLIRKFQDFLYKFITETPYTEFRTRKYTEFREIIRNSAELNNGKFRGSKVTSVLNFVFRGIPKSHFRKYHSFKPNDYEPRHSIEAHV